MKIVVLLFASFLGFGLASHEAVRVEAPKQAMVKTENTVELEAPVMDVVLDTVEITISAPGAIAGI